MSGVELVLETNRRSVWWAWHADAAGRRVEESFA
jgi:hypothetical protein